jgi:hypothetical protein
MNWKTCLITLALIIASSGLRAELEAGNNLPAISVKDQHEVAYTLETGIQYLMVSFDMSTGKAANKFLEKKGADFLPDNKAVFLSNIHGMPWIGRKFALPKMRKYPHRILLADEPEEAILAEFPQKEDRVTVFQLNKQLGIVSIKFWDPSSGSAPFSD